MLTVVSESEPYIFPRGQAESVWHCKCDCGGEIDVRNSYLAMGKKTSCGCQNLRKRKTLRKNNSTADLTGKKFGHLLVLERIPNEYTGYRGILWKVRCELCGTVKPMTPNSLRDSVSCGCQRTGKSRIKICNVCKKIYIGHRIQTYCSRACSKDAVKRRGSNVRKCGETSTCELCGKPYIITGANQRYCKNCAGKKVTRMNKEKYKEKHSAERKELFDNSPESVIKPCKNPKKGQRICVICGSEFEGSSHSEYCPRCKTLNIRKDQIEDPDGELKYPVQRKCSQCGKLYWTKNKYSYMCEDCAKAVKSSSVLRTRVCARCGAEFEGYPRSKYCPHCKPEVEREKAAARRKRKPRKIGSEDICEACGKPYIVKSGLQKYCPECAKTVVPETVREHKREYMAGHSEELNAARGEKRKKSKEK